AARLQAGRDQALGDVRDVTGEGGRGERTPTGGLAAAQDHGVGGLGRVGEGQVGDGTGRRARRERGGAGLAHDAVFVPDDLDPGAVRQVGPLPGPLQIPAYAHDGSRSRLVLTYSC